MNIDSHKLSYDSKHLFTQFNKLPLTRIISFLEPFKSNTYINELFKKVTISFHQTNDLFNTLVKNKQLSLNPIYSIIKNNYTNNNTTNSSLKKYQMMSIPPYFNSRFMSHKAKKIVYNKCIYRVTIEFEVYNIQLRIKFYTTRKWTTIIKKKVKHIILRILFIITFFKAHICVNDHILTMDIFLLNLHKKLPTHRNNKVHIDNINSGFTVWADNKDTHIIIYRSEEAEKLVLHELIHFFKLDFHLLDYNFSEILNVSPSLEFTPNEAFTELLAVLLNSSIISLEIYKTTKYAYDILNIETLFGLFQCSKILFHYNYKDTNHFFIPYSNTLYHPVFYQKSCILSYFFVKVSLLCNIHDTTHFFSKHMDNYTLQINNDSKHDFINLIKKTLYSDRFRNNIQHFLDLIHTYIFTPRTNKIISQKCVFNKHKTKCMITNKKNLNHSISNFGKTDLFNTNRMTLIEMT